MFGFTEASKFLLRSLSTGDEGLRACTYIPLAEVKAFLSCKSGGFFFLRFSGERRKARSKSHARREDNKMRITKCGGKNADHEKIKIIN